MIMHSSSNVYVICIYSPSLALDPEQLSARGGEAQYLVTPDSYSPWTPHTHMIIIHRCTHTNHALGYLDSIQLWTPRRQSTKTKNIWPETQEKIRDQRCDRDRSWCSQYLQNIVSRVSRGAVDSWAEPVHNSREERTSSDGLFSSLYLHQDRSDFLSWRNCC